MIGCHLCSIFLSTQSFCLLSCFGLLIGPMVQLRVSFGEQKARLASQGTCANVNNILRNSELYRLMVNCVLYTSYSKICKSRIITVDGNPSKLNFELVKVLAGALFILCSANVETGKMSNPEEKLLPVFSTTSLANLWREQSNAIATPIPSSTVFS